MASYRRTNEPSPLEVETSTAGAAAARDLETFRPLISGLDLDVRILARELYGREGRDLEVINRTIIRMTSRLARVGELLVRDEDTNGC